MLFECFIILFLLYVFMHLTKGISRSSSCLVGKTAIVTGANSGIGFQTVLNLAARGCRVVMADVEDMEKSKRDIIKFTNNNNIVTKKLDLSSFKSVREFACDVIKTEPHIDILVNNAGISASKENRTEDGLHPVMQINYFGHFLLTHLLIDLLKKSAPSRIVFTSSYMSLFNNLSTKNLNHDGSSNPARILQIYCNSKFAMLIASDTFAAKLRGSGVTSNSINPGTTRTVMISRFFSSFKNSSLVKFVVYLFVGIFCKSSWEGAQVLVHAAVSKKLERVSGKHFWECRSFFKPLGAYNEEFCKGIWNASEELVGLATNERL